MNCIHCNYKIDAHTAPDDLKAEPRPGDLSLCVSCGEPMIFDENLQFRKLTAEEEIAHHQDILRHQNIIQLINSLK